MTDTRTEFHRQYYASGIWRETKFLGIYCQKFVSDLWNYQEIIVERRPSLIVEFGAFQGGGTLYLSTILSLVRPDAKMLSVEFYPGRIDPRVLKQPNLEIMGTFSTHPSVAKRISALRTELPGPAFFILDSDHSKANVLMELEAIRPVLQPNDYVIVEDSNINGHPVLPDFGPGPMEAIEEYERKHPVDFIHDEMRERKFGFTCAPHGYLIKR